MCTSTTHPASRPRKLDGWINNFNVDLMALVAGVDAATEALADGGGSVVSIGTTATADTSPPVRVATAHSRLPSPTGHSGQAQVLGARGIRCNVVSPGPIMIEGGDWDTIRKHMADFYEATKKNHPGGDLGEAQDVANAVAFLAGDAAKHVNGTNITVDGGFLKRVDY